MPYRKPYRLQLDTSTHASETTRATRPSAIRHNRCALVVIARQSHPGKIQGAVKDVMLGYFHRKGTSGLRVHGIREGFHGLRFVLHRGKQRSYQFAPTTQTLSVRLDVSGRMVGETKVG